MEKKLTRNALEDISKAIQIEPNKHEYYFLKGKWEYLTGRPEDAMISFRRAYELEPSKKTYRDYYQAIKSEMGYKWYTYRSFNENIKFNSLMQAQ